MAGAAGRLRLSTPADRSPGSLRLPDAGGRGGPAPLFPASQGLGLPRLPGHPVRLGRPDRQPCRAVREAQIRTGASWNCFGTRHPGGGRDPGRACPFRRCRQAGRQSRRRRAARRRRPDGRHAGRRHRGRSSACPHDRRPLDRALLQRLARHLCGPPRKGVHGGGQPARGQAIRGDVRALFCRQEDAPVAEPAADPDRPQGRRAGAPTCSANSASSSCSTATTASRRTVASNSIG